MDVVQGLSSLGLMSFLSGIKIVILPCTIGFRHNSYFHDLHFFATATSVNLKCGHKKRLTVNARLIFIFDGTLNGPLRAAVFRQNARLNLATC